MTTTLTINGRIPSKKNSKRWIVRGKRKVLVPSEKHQEWHEAAWWEIKTQRPKKGIKRCSIEISLYSKDKGSFDLDNKASSILDLLVDMGILIDDSYKVVYRLLVEYGGIDRSIGARICIND